jgi:hypothetical protein
MKKWHVLFEDERNGSKILEAGNDPAQISKNFHSAAATGRIDGRKVLGMWITQQMGEQVSVLMVHGAAPDDIYRQYRMVQPARHRQCGGVKPTHSEPG